MEYGLRQTGFTRRKDFPSLNPCCNGICSLSEMARESARLYFDFEIESLRYTIARERANGKKVTALTNRLANLIDWRSKL